MIDGSEEAPSKLLSDNSPNPGYTIWFRKDNCVLSWLLASNSEKLVSIVFSLKTSKQVWDSLQTRFSAASWSCIALLKRQLQTIVQGNQSCSSFLEDAKQLADKLAVAGQPVNDQDFITFLLGGLRATYTPFITSYNFACREKELSLDEFQYELLSFETLVEASMQNQNFAFAAKHTNYPKRKPAGRRPPSELAAMAIESNNTFEQQTWYADSGANAHITANAANLTALHLYDDHDTVEGGNDSGYKATDDQWHDRQGHPANSTPEYLSFFLQIKEPGNMFKICYPCQLGKAKRLPFSDSNRQSARPLALIHSDV
ncbi:hypothetical protein SADUNF_Sadunf04G0098300 [Salix dunnii]|uniref:Retrotransposon Copia-like N-terminal domain-containing protein n=1 Tax=Salix dunnii TaxID=1413687 RepID=A0A835K7S2_9ROSI|nr:hypothetical protein SADUNF_Sadunf04G0098300 [Salix dunnii]